MNYSGIKKLIIVGLSVLLSACISKVKNLSVDKDLNLDDQTGYLFMTVDTNFDFSRFAISGKQYTQLENPVFYNNKNYYLLPLKAGEYYIHSFTNTSGGEYRFTDDDLWRFNVSSGVISYIGEFKARNIYGHLSRFSLINHSSFAMEYLEEKYPNILSQRKIEYRGPGEDFFFNLISSEKEIVK